MNYVYRLLLGQTCKRLYAVGSSPFPLWRVVKFKAAWSPTAHAKAQWFVTWLLNKATAVEELVVQLDFPEGTDEDHLLEAARSVPPWPR